MNAPAKSKKPTRKVRFGGIGATLATAIATAIAAIANVPHTNPIVVLVAGAIVSAIQFGVSYQTKSGA